MQRIAYFGPSGTFTEMALVRMESVGILSGEVDRVPAASQPAALAMIRDRKVDGAVVPIESSVEGSIPATMDALVVGSRLQIVAETDLDVSFSIVVRPGTPMSAVKTVRAYPVAAAQVRTWLEQNLPSVEVQMAASNAAAAQDVSDGLADAAVSTELAGQQRGLITVAGGVADQSGARTRFVLVTGPCTPPAPTGADRTSVVLELANEPGSLYRAFAEFATRGIDLTRIESRPTRAQMGTYRFYLDCVGHIEDPAVGEALKALHRIADTRFLGSWPVGTSPGTPPPSDSDASGWLERLRRGGGSQ